MTPRTGDERLAWIALARTRGVGPERMAVLIEACQTAIGAISAPIAFLGSVPGIPEAVAREIVAASLDAAAREVAAVEAEGGVMLLPGDVHFPDLLMPLEDQPLCLSAAGDLGLLDRPAVAIVGSRDHSRYGREVCESIASRAALAGLAVVSGMARGLDAVAHEAALQVGGGTIAVLGNGLGVVYPTSNRRLYAAVREHGLLLTESPHGARPMEGSFPRRNRIIAALARVTVVIEAAATSGALITASVANDLSRDVMAVPGPITSARSVGTNRLIQHGAYPLLGIEDLLARFPEASVPARSTSVEPGRPGPLAARVMQRLGLGPAHVDELSRSMSLPAAEVLAVLASLEVRGLVRQEPGMVFAPVAAALAAEAVPRRGRGA
ncbi:MAG TPA: DNA-processing protein DprA [Gemmatimonadales bacterium]